MSLIPTFLLEAMRTPLSDEGKAIYKDEKETNAQRLIFPDTILLLQIVKNVVLPLGCLHKWENTENKKLYEKSEGSNPVS